MPVAILTSLSFTSSAFLRPDIRLHTVSFPLTIMAAQLQPTSFLLSLALLSQRQFRIAFSDNGNFIQCFKELLLLMQM
jgi:hypothetical protein